MVFNINIGLKDIIIICLLVFGSVLYYTDKVYNDTTTVISQVIDKNIPKTIPINNTVTTNITVNITQFAKNMSEFKFINLSDMGIIDKENFNCDPRLTTIKLSICQQEREKYYTGKYIIYNADIRDITESYILIGMLDINGKFIRLSTSHINQSVLFEYDKKDLVQFTKKYEEPLESSNFHIIGLK